MTRPPALLALKPDLTKAAERGEALCAGEIIQHP